MVDWNAAANWLLAIAGIIGAVSAIAVVIRKIFSGAMQKALAQTNVKIDLMRGEVKSISDTVDKVEDEAR